MKYLVQSTQNQIKYSLQIKSSSYLNLMVFFIHTDELQLLSHQISTL